MGSAYIHICGNLTVSGLYLLAFLSALRKLVRDKSLRNPVALSLTVLLGIVFVAFMLQAVFSLAWRQIDLESFWLLVAAAPGIAHLVLIRRNKILFGSEALQNPKDRFEKIKDEFLSVASHELRTPLSVINGFAEILVREKLGPLNDEQKRRVRKILMQGQRLNRIIDELLDLSRIRSGKIECRSDVFDLVPVLKACLDDHQIVCEQQKIELKDEIPDLLPDVVGDLERVTQIIVNLLNNAIKYTEPGGSIKLTASFDKDKKEVIVSVLDTGIGIDKADQEKIFEEFYRARHHHGRKYSGSGLGLTIVKQLVEAQNGRVGVTSEGLGKGSSFFFTLPTAKTGQVNSSSHFIKPLSDH